MSGRRPAYLGVVLGFSASITGNIASTLLTPSAVTLWLRVPVSVLWPVLTYVGIETLTRVQWQSRWTHHLARLVLIAPVAGVAAYVSYLHQHHLLILMGEKGMTQLFGPLAIDGALYGFTFVLLLTGRTGQADTDKTRTSLADKVRAVRTTVQDIGQALVQDRPDVQPDMSEDTEVLSTDILPDMSTDKLEDKLEDKPEDKPARRPKWDRDKADVLIRDTPMSDADIADAVGCSAKTIQRRRADLVAQTWIPEEES